MITKRIFHMMDELNKTDFNRHFLLYIFIFLAIAGIIPLWIVQYIPSQNGPLYILVTQIFSQYNNPDFNFPQNFEMEFLLVPNLFFHFVVYLLSFFLPLLIAYKLVLSIAMVLLPVSVFYFINAVDPRKLLWGFLAFIFTYNYYLFKGYDSFYLSFSLFLFYFGYLVKNNGQLRIRNYAILSALALLIYFTHIFTFLIAIIITFFYFLPRSRSLLQLIKSMTVFIPGLLAFLQYVVVLFAGKDSGVRGNVIRYDPPQEIVQEFLYFAMYSYTQWTVIFFLIPLLFLLYMLFKKLIALYKNDISNRKLSTGYFIQLLEREKILFMLVVLLIMFAVAPREIMGWPKFNTRFIPFIVFFLFLAAEPFSSKALNRIFLGSVFAASIATYVIMGSNLVTINREYDDYTSGIAVIEKNKTLLPVNIEAYEVGKIKPLNWAFSYYNVFKGGTTNKVLAYAPGRVPLRYKYPVDERLPSFDPDHAQNANMEKIHQAYDYVLFWGADNEVFRLFKNAGYEPLHQKGKLHIYSKGTG